MRDIYLDSKVSLGLLLTSRTHRVGVTNDAPTDLDSLFGFWTMPTTLMFSSSRDAGLSFSTGSEPIVFDAVRE